MGIRIGIHFRLMQNIKYEKKNLQKRATSKDKFLLQVLFKGMISNKLHTMFCLFFPSVMHIVLIFEKNILLLDFKKGCNVKRPSRICATGAFTVR